MSTPLRLHSEWGDAARRDPSRSDGVPEHPSRSDGVPKNPSRSDGPPDSVSSWLDVLTRMLPARQGAEVREELESHVRERVRDLVLAGTDEAAATRTAIAELGDAAAVAQRFREAARTPYRRLAMNLAVLGVAGAALVTSMVAVRSPGQGSVPGPSYQPGVVDRVAAGAKEPGGAKLDAHDTPLRTVLEDLARSIDAEMVVRWAALNEAGVLAPEPVTVKAGPGGLSTVFEAVNEAVLVAYARDASDRAIDYRLRDGVLEIATPGWFDRRESTVVRYDLAPIEEQGVATEEFVELIRQFVSPDDWKDNGGDLAEVRVVGRLAFIKAPARIHDGVRWFFDQVNGKADEAQERGAADGDAEVRTYPIQHADASETLDALKALQSIREIDFTKWAVNAHSNAIIGQAPARYHEWVERALRDVDTPERNGQDKQRSAIDPAAAEPARELALDQLMVARRLEFQIRDMPLIHSIRQAQLAPFEESALPTLRLALAQANDPRPTFRALALAHAPAETILGAVRALLRGVEGARLEMYVDAGANTLILSGPSEEQVLAAEQVVWKLDELARVIKQGKEGAVGDPPGTER